LKSATYDIESDDTNRSMMKLNGLQYLLKERICSKSSSDVHSNLIGRTDKELEEIHKSLTKILTQKRNTSKSGYGLWFQFSLLVGFGVIVAALVLICSSLVTRIKAKEVKVHTS
jgi:hypothetical protein